MDKHRDYTGEFMNSVGNRLLRYVAPVLLTLAGGFALIFFENVTEGTFLHKVGALALLAIIILALFALYISIAQLANLWIHNRYSSALTFPPGISLDDILPYTIEEERTDKVYSLNDDAVTFDVISRTTYRVRGGCSKVVFIEHTFTGFHLKNKADLLVELKSISGKGVVEANPVTSSNTSHCTVTARFETVLAPMEEATYRITLTYKKYQSICFTENGVRRMVHCKRAKLGIKRLALSIEFPHGYCVLQPEYVVEGSSAVRIYRVEALCEAENPDLNVQIQRAPIRMELVVNKPIPSLKYMLSWGLPESSMLSKLRFPGEQQRRMLEKGAVLDAKE